MCVIIVVNVLFCLLP